MALPSAALSVSGDPRPFQAALRSWYRRARRRLPWREAPSLYKTVVSEFMLQQTQVKTVLPYFARWMDALPGFAELARADEATVLKLWEGLGYYSRARNLHRLAREVALRPAPPRTAAEWRELPGVGPYTAAAIASIAFGDPAACVDGNVVRILARLGADRTPYRDGGSAAKALAPLARHLLPAGDPGDHNQAMMELGATVCLRRNPLCSACPVAAFCAAAREGDPTAYPRLAPRATERKAVVRIWCERNGSLLLHRADAGARRLAGLHELPTAEQAGCPAPLELLARKRRSITRYQIEESIYRASPAAVRAGDGCVWVRLADLAALTLSGPHRKWVAEILARQAATRSAPGSCARPRASSSARVQGRAPGGGAKIR